MRTPEELHLVDWSALTHGYGTAEAVPDWIRALYDEDAAVVGEALDMLFEQAMHPETVYPASVAAVPYLAHAAVHAVHRRDRVLAFLVDAGRHHDRWWDAAEEPAPVEVSAELPFLLRLSDDPDPEVRRQLVRVAYWAIGDSRPPVLAALAACHRADPSERVRAEALEVLSRISPDREGQLRAALADPSPAVRATAALGLLELAGPPHPPELLDVLIADGGHPGFGMPYAVYHFGIDATETRVRALLDGNPELLRAVAVSWVAAGDHDGRGSRRAVELAEGRRGHGTEVSMLLVDALATRHEPDVLRETLKGLGRWAAHHPDPAVLADAVLPYATHPNFWIADQAQQLLGRTGDTRLLTAVAAPLGEALVELAARSDDPDVHRRALRPLRCYFRNHDRHSRAAEVVESLTPGAAARLLPELIALLGEKPGPDLLRALGGTGLTDPELLARIQELGIEPALSLAAAVAAARLGGDPGPALRLLAERLEAGDAAPLAEVALLGPLGAPLASLVERHLADGSPARRSLAATALWRITGDPARVAPALLALVREGRHDLPVLTALRETGAPLPPDVRAQVEEWAHPERRTLSRHGLRAVEEDDELYDAARLLLAPAGADGHAHA
ncbi:hypothetical protein [Kitasatospora sp. NPDC057198]|uniref:hypothetical protein n=1 Tax=Kitasatospora sp. NPDC057198 TaxID=3346046 RepID=UPI00362E907F